MFKFDVENPRVTERQSAFDLVQHFESVVIKAVIFLVWFIVLVTMLVKDSGAVLAALRMGRL